MTFLYIPNPGMLGRSGKHWLVFREPRRETRILLTFWRSYFRMVLRCPRLGRTKPLVFGDRLAGQNNRLISRRWTVLRVLGADRAWLRRGASKLRFREALAAPAATPTTAAPAAASVAIPLIFSTVARLTNCSRSLWSGF